MPYETLPPAFWIVVVTLLGLVIGSFLNVVIYRWPREESIVFPSSHCGSCGVAIRPYDNIPVLSYLVLGGKCRSCKTHYSFRYPAVELLTGLLFLAAYVVDGPTPKLAIDCVFLAMLVPLVFIDAEHQLLPAAITHTGLVFALVARVVVPNLFGMGSASGGGAWMLGLAGSPDWYVSLAGAAAGATLGGGTLFALAIGYEIIRKREGMGLGDVSMMCMVGAYVGWELTLLTVLIASVVGAVSGIVLSRGSNVSEFKVPFGVFLGIGAAISLLAGPAIVGWYIGRLA